MCRLATIAFAISLVPGLAGLSVAQEAPAINANNIERLASVSVIDFDSLPEHAGEIINGRVYIDEDGTDMAVVNRDGQIVVLDDLGEVQAVSDILMTEDGFPATFIDDGQSVASIHTAGDRYFVSFITIHRAIQVVEVQSENKPVAIWLDNNIAWLEVMPNVPDEAPYLVQVPLPVGDHTHLLNDVVSEADLTMAPFAPATDEDMVARIGRLTSPLAIRFSASLFASPKRSERMRDLR